MRKTTIRCACALCALILCLSWFGAPSPAQADGYATYGNAQGNTTFYVYATGAATITLTQSSQGLVEKQYAYNSASTANEYIYARYTVLYKGTQDASWQQSAIWTGEVYTLNFPRADVYTVRVLPISVSSISTNQTNWRYSRWISPPSWYVSGVRNCSVYSNSSYTPAYNPTPKPTARPTAKPTSTPQPYQFASVPVTLYYWSVDGYDIASPQVQYMTPGVHTVPNAKNISGYTFVAVTSRQVNVNYLGVATPNVVYYLYKRITSNNNNNNNNQNNNHNNNNNNNNNSNTGNTGYTGSPVSGTTGINGRTAVYPTMWDTRFKPGTSARNASCGEKLPNLYDNDRYTAFSWTVWNSEWKDGIPEITAYFNGDTVGAIGIRNGNTTSSKTFSENARATNWRVRVYTKDGQYEDTDLKMKSSFTADYQVFSLNRTYTDVERVEIFMMYYSTGSQQKNKLTVSDMMFFVQ